MNILHINTFETGGAAKAVLRLHEGLMHHNANSNVLVLHAYGDPKDSVRSFLDSEKSLLQKIKYSLFYRWDQFLKQRVLASKVADYEVFSFPDTIYDLSRHPLVQEADIIHLHWVGGFLDYRSFFKKVDKPIVWTLHDCNPFQGGFHYLRDYLDHQSSFYKLDRQIRKCKKESLLHYDNLEVVNLSSWNYRISSGSGILGHFRHQIIPNGINLDVFKKIDKSAARRIFNLPQDKNIILFVADHIDNKRKGFAYLLEAIKGIDAEENLLVVVGNGKLSAEIIPTRFLNFIGDDRLLAAAYSAADVYVIPTLEDNLPNTVLEAMACETPVIGFDVGGLPDMVLPNKTGLLARPRDAQDLSQKIRYLLDDKEFRDLLGKNARSVAEKEYNIQIQTQKYIQLYEEVLKQTDKVDQDAQLSPQGTKMIRTTR